MSSLLPIAAATALAVAGVIAKSRRGSRAISREEFERLVQLRKAEAPKRAAKPDQRGTAQGQAPVPVKDLAIMQVTTQQQGRSTIADDIVSVGPSEAPRGWNFAWVSLEPLYGYPGGGPILLVNLTSPDNSRRDTANGAVIAPGYPSAMVKKRGSPYQLLRPKKIVGGAPGEWRSLSQPVSFAEQEEKKVKLFPTHGEGPRLLVVAEEMTRLLNGSQGGRDVEVLQAIALLFMLRHEERWAKGRHVEITSSLDSAITEYIHKQGVKLPEYLRGAARKEAESSDTEEDVFQVVEATYEESPRELILQTVSGRGAVRHVAESLGAALKKNITAGWGKDDNPANPSVCPFLGKGGDRIEYVSNGAYALRADSAEWLAQNTPAGTPRSRPLDRPWTRCGENRPDLKGLIPSGPLVSMQIVGRGRQRMLGDTVILSNPSGGLAHVSARNLAICVARALQEGWRVRLESMGGPLDFIIVRASTSRGERLEAFVATIRVE
jgi:hypothetical protein